MRICIGRPSPRSGRGWRRRSGQRRDGRECIYIYIYIYVYTYMYVYIYIYIYIYMCMYTYREREIERDLCTYKYISMCVCIYIYIERERYVGNHICMCIYVYIYIYRERGRDMYTQYITNYMFDQHKSYISKALTNVRVRPVHLLRVVLLRVLESNFPGDSLYKIIRTWEFPPLRIKSLLESNPPKSKLLVGGLVVICGAQVCCCLLVQIW